MDLNKIRCAVVTGGSGFIGHHIACWLRDIGHQDLVIVNMDHANTGIDLASSLLDHSSYAGIHPFDELFMSMAGVENFVEREQLKPDIVFHCAADAAEVASNVRSKVVIHDNICLSNDVLNFCVKNRSMFVFTSSIAAEEPVDIYGLSKRFTEKQADLYNDMFGLEFRIARLRNVYGPGQSFWSPARNVIGIWTWHVLNGLQYPVFNSGKCVRQFSYIDDVINKFDEFMNCKTRNMAANIGSSMSFSVSDLSRKFCRTAEAIGIHAESDLLERKEVEISHVKNGRNEPDRFLNMYTNGTKDLEKGIENYLVWAKDLWEKEEDLITTAYLENMTNLIDAVDLPDQENSYIPGMRSKALKLNQKRFEESQEDIPF